MATATLDTVLGIQVFAISGRPLDLGLLGLAAFAPSALLVLVTGSVADRFDRRVGRRVGPPRDKPRSPPRCTPTSRASRRRSPRSSRSRSCFGVARAFADPPARALPADIVEPERVPWVVARSSVTWQIATILGPVLGGFLYAADTQSPYVAVFVLMLASAVLVLVVPAARPRATRRTGDAGHRRGRGRSRRRARGRSGRDAVEGFRFVRSQPIVLGAISLDLFAVLFGGAVALLPALADERLHVGAVGIGWLRAAAGIGAALGDVAPRGATGPPARRPVAARRGRDVRRRHDRAGRHAHVRDRVRRDARARGRGLDQRVRARDARAAGDARLEARAACSRSRASSSARRTSSARSSPAWPVRSSARRARSSSAAPRRSPVALTWARAFPALRTVDRFPTAVEPELE